MRLIDCYIALPRGRTFVLDLGDGGSATFRIDDLRGFLNNNAEGLSIAEVRQICSLAKGDRFRGGGGAQPVWSLRRVE
jgi:hypothetical protein